jgi:outer membrane protein assembly factor BamB
MARQGVSRRRFLSSLGAVAAASQAGLTGVGTTQSEPSSDPTFGTPIEAAWAVSHDRELTDIGSIRDDVLYAGFREGGYTPETEVTRIDRLTGSKDWSKTVDDYVFGPTERDGRIYFAGRDGVYCWDASTGEELWYRALGDGFITLVDVDDTLLVTAHRYEDILHGAQSATELLKGVAYGLSADDGETQWTVHSDVALWSPEIEDDRLFVNETRVIFKEDGIVTEEGRLAAFDVTDGSREWESAQIEPKFFNKSDDVLFTVTGDDNLQAFDLDGTTRWTTYDVTDYFYTDEEILVSRLDGGVDVFEHSGQRLTDEPLYSSTEITTLRSTADADPFLLGTSNELIAIDGSDFTEQWRVPVPAAPTVIRPQQEIAFTSYGGNQLQAFDVRNGDVVWQEEIPYVDDIRFTAYDGFCYVYGTEAPVQAFAGERGRVLTAVHNAEASDNSLSGTIAGALGWRDSLSQAQTAVENGEYEKAQRLVDRAEQRRTGVQGALGLAGLGTAYSATRAGGSKLQQSRLASAAEDVESLYPISEGTLEGVEPTDLLAQARTAKSSIDSLWALKLRELTSNDYTDLINRLNKLADRHSDLVETSQTLADVDRSLLPESLTSDLRSAVEDGDIERIDALVAKVERAERLFDQLEDLRQTIEQSSLSVSTANYSEFVTQELEQTGGVFEGVTLGRVFEALADGVEAYESSRGAFDVFDVTAVESTLTAALAAPHQTEEATLREIRNYSALFEACETVEEYLSKVDFTGMDASRDAYRRRARSMFANRDIGGLSDLAETLHQMHAGRWSHSDLFVVSPIEFEYLVAALFADMGYEVAVTEERGDKGIDVIARSASEVLAIQVKQHSEGNNVGRPTVQQTIGAMAQAGADNAVIVSSAGFTKTARQASNELGDAVNLIDGADLVQLLTESRLHPSRDGSYYRSRANTSRSNSRQSNRNTSSSSRNRSSPRSLSEQEAYDVLDLDPPVSDEEIKARYRQKVKETHPDVGGDEDEFRKVRNAYAVLSSD